MTTISQRKKHIQFWSIRKEHFLQYSIWVLTAILVLAPLIPIVYGSLRDRPLYDSGGILSLDNYVGLITNPEFHEVILNTLYFAMLTTVISISLGTLLAILIGRTDLPGRNLISSVLLWPFYLSPLVLSLAWVTMYAPAGYVTLLVEQQLHLPTWNLYSIPGMALVASVFTTPIVYLNCSGSVSAADPSLEDVARSVGASPLKVLSKITVPLLRPAILQSAIFIFTLSLEVLSIPLILGWSSGIDFFVSFLYKEWALNVVPNHGLVSAAAIMLLLLVSILVYIRNKLLGSTERFVTVRGKAAHPTIFRLGWIRWVIFAIIAIYMFFTTILPFIGLTLTAFTKYLTPLVPPWEFFTMDWWVLIFSAPTYTRSITNSIIIALVGGFLTTILAALIALVAHRSRFRFRKSLDFLAMYPRAVPGMIVGIGFFWALAVIKPLGFIRNTIWAIMIAFGVRNLTMAYGAISPMLTSFGEEIDGAARTVGADWWETCRKILLRLLRPALSSSFAILVISLIKEYSPAVFLVAPGSEVMGLTMLQVWHQGFPGPVAALSLVQVGIITVLVLTGRKFFKVKLYA